jgi:hypothetical protein
MLAVRRGPSDGSSNGPSLGSIAEEPLLRNTLVIGQVSTRVHERSCNGHITKSLLKRRNTYCDRCSVNRIGPNAQWIWTAVKSTIGSASTWTFYTSARDLSYWLANHRGLIASPMPDGPPRLARTLTLFPKGPERTTNPPAHT